MAVLDASGQQAGDQQISAAGRDQITIGLGAEALADLQEVQLRLVDVLERTHGAIRVELGENNARLAQLSERFALYQALVADRLARDAAALARVSTLAAAALAAALLALGLAALGLILSLL